MQEQQHYEAGNQISFSLNWPEFNGLVKIKEDRGIYIRGMRWLLSPAFYHSSFVQQVMILYSFNCSCCLPGNNCSLPGSSVRGILPGKNTGEGCHFLLQGIFPTQGSNPHLLHWQADSLSLSHQGSPAYILISAQISELWLLKLWENKSVLF